MRETIDQFTETYEENYNYCQECDFIVDEDYTACPECGNLLIEYNYQDCLKYGIDINKLWS